MTILLSTAYLPPVSYLQKCIESDEIIIDQHEHFIKQTYRNRCRIYGPNGKMDLIIPIIHENVFRIPIREVKIANDTPWNKIHWKSLTAAYRNSPYFEFYEDSFQKIYENPSKFLFEFNLDLLKLIFDLYKIKSKISLSENYTDKPEIADDLRNSFHPKKNKINVQPYHQVFSDRHGFINDLSCVDFLFNANAKY